MVIVKLIKKIGYIFFIAGLINLSLSSCEKSVDRNQNITSNTNGGGQHKMHKITRYNVNKQPSFVSSKQLENIVNNVVKYNQNNFLPVNNLSITLIDTKTNERAEYNGAIQRYPASVVKLFWLVIAYQKISLGEIKEADLLNETNEMIDKSTNKAASKVIDVITDTKSTPKELTSGDFNLYKQRREELNTFFRSAGYSNDIDISHKTFDVENLNGFDKQLRGNSKENPVRNRVTTNDTARLMYEIINNQSVTLEASTKMKKMLMRNIESTLSSQQPLISHDSSQIKSFLGQGIPSKDVENIISKTGITSKSRQEIAFIKSQDGKVQYILAVFGNDPIYSSKERIFPEISSLIYREMKAKK
jgi:beta-lactamase class A